MSVLDNIYKAAQIGRTIGDPIGQGLIQRGQKQFEEQQALQRFEQQKKLQDIQDQASLNRMLTQEMTTNPVSGVTRLPTENVEGLGMVSSPPAIGETEQSNIDQGYSPMKRDVTPLGGGFALDKNLRQALQDKFRNNALSDAITKAQAEYQARAIAEANKPTKIPTFNTVTGTAQERLLKPGEQTKFDAGELPLNQTAFSVNSPIASKSDVVKEGKQTKSIEDSLKQDTVELLKDPDVKNWEEFDRRTKQAHKLWDDARKSNDYSAVTSHLLETYQRMNTNQAVRQFTYNSVKGNQPLSSWIEGAIDGIQRGGNGISDQTFNELMKAIDSMHVIAKDDVLEKIKGYQKSADSAGYGDQFRERVVPKLGFNAKELDSNNVPSGTWKEGDPIPEGMKVLRNKRTGETKMVPQ